MGMEEELKNMRNNKVNIDFLKEKVDLSKLQVDVEKLIRNGKKWRKTLMIEMVFALLLIQDHKIIEHRISRFNYQVV